MLRAVRLEAALQLKIDAQTESWIRRDAGCLPGSSPERIRYELMQILDSRNLAAHVWRMQVLGLLEAALPEVAGLARSTASVQLPAASELDLTLEALSGVERLTAQGDWQPHEEAVLGPFADRLAEYLTQTVCDYRTRGLLLRWATLLHRTLQTGFDSITTEPRQVREPSEGEEAARITARFRFSAQEVTLVRAIVANAHYLGSLAARGRWDRRDLYRYFQSAACAPIEPLLLAWAGRHTLQGRALAKGHELAPLATEVLSHYFSHPQELVTPPTLVTGVDVMEWLGLEQGPLVGVVLREMREEQAMGVISTRDQARELMRARYARGVSG